MMKNRNRAGFTLIELLIVIAIIAVIAAIVFVALNPLKRFQDARDARRTADVMQLLLGLKLHQVDNGGYYISAVTNMTTGTVYMVGTDSNGCTGYNSYCDTAVNSSSCLDLSGLTTAGYLGQIPISPAGIVTWTEGHTGYTLVKSSTGILTASSCESEDSPEITFTR